MSKLSSGRMSITSDMGVPICTCVNAVYVTAWFAVNGYFSEWLPDITGMRSTVPDVIWRKQVSNRNMKREREHKHRTHLKSCLPMKR